MTDLVMKMMVWVCLKVNLTLSQDNQIHGQYAMHKLVLKEQENLKDVYNL